MGYIQFEIWGAVPFPAKVTEDRITQRILSVIRKEPRSCASISAEAGTNVRQAKRVLDRLVRFDLVRQQDEDGRRWVSNFPIYTASELAVADEIGRKHAKTEAEILRSSIPQTRKVYAQCTLSADFPWTDVAWILVGGIIADFAVFDRVRFFPEYRDERLLPPLHSDGTRWGYVGYEVDGPPFPRRKYRFYHNSELGETGGLAVFGRHGPSGKPTRRIPAHPLRLLNPPYREIILGLAKHPMRLEELQDCTHLSMGALSRALEDLSSFPGAVRIEAGVHSLRIPILPADDLGRIVGHADSVAETIHKEVSVPCMEERQMAGKDLGLRFPLPEAQLPRDIALQLLAEEGDLPSIPEPPMPWSFGVWGWQGQLPQWEEAKRLMR